MAAATAATVTTCERWTVLRIHPGSYRWRYLPLNQTGPNPRILANNLPTHLPPPSSVLQLAPGHTRLPCFESRSADTSARFHCGSSQRHRLDETNTIDWITKKKKKKKRKEKRKEKKEREVAPCQPDAHIPAAKPIQNQTERISRFTEWGGSQHHLAGTNEGHQHLHGTGINVAITAILSVRHLKTCKQRRVLPFSISFLFCRFFLCFCLSSDNYNGRHKERERAKERER